MVGGLSFLALLLWYLVYGRIGILNIKIIQEKLARSCKQLKKTPKFKQGLSQDCLCSLCFTSKDNADGCCPHSQHRIGFFSANWHLFSK